MQINETTWAAKEELPQCMWRYGDTLNYAHNGADQWRMSWPGYTNDHVEYNYTTRAVLL